MYGHYVWELCDPCREFDLSTTANLQHTARHQSTSSSPPAQHMYACLSFLLRHLSVHGFGVSQISYCTCLFLVLFLYWIWNCEFFLNICYTKDNKCGSRGAFSCAGACRRPAGVVFIVSRLLAAACWRMQVLAGDYGSSLPCRQDGGAHWFKNGKRLLFPLSA